MKRHIAISKNKSLLSFILDRFTILHISENYKKAEFEAAHCRKVEQSAATRRLIAVFVGDEDYFYSVLVTLMSHYDIIVANPVGA